MVSRGSARRRSTDIGANGIRETGEGVLTLEEVLSQLTGDDIMIGLGIMFMIYGLVILNQEDE